MKKIKKESKVLCYLKGLKKREKLLLFMSILIFTFIVIEQALIKPLKTKQLSLQNSISKKETNKVEIIDKIAKKDMLYQELEIVKGDYDKAIKEFPKTEKQADIIKNITDTSTLSGVSISNFNFINDSNLKEDDNNSSDDEILLEDNKENKIEKNSEDDIITHSFMITVNGDFNSIVNFMKKVEEMPRQISITGVKISNDPSNVNKLQGIITASYYSLNYKEKERYDFNKGKWGKENFFK
ncbi:MAG: type 4a pilus biogenesis protein PilO [Clostridium sp.]|uniref:type 4a pilus biogenesis protein PilO n=1 Tax=Clostridium sp. TaxID=1506 RepID=UPI003F30634B